MSAETADSLLCALAHDVPSFGYGARAADECVGFLHESMRRQGLAVPSLTLIAEANDWGKTGDRSSRDDCRAVFAVGTEQTNLGIALAYSLDGPEYGETDSDLDGRSEDADGAETVGARMTESFHITVVEVASDAMREIWTARGGDRLFDDRGLTRALQSAIVDGIDDAKAGKFKALMQLEVASPKDGDVSVSEWNQKAGVQLMERSGCALGFYTAVAMALKQLAAKHHYLKPLRKAFSRRSGVPKDAMPLFDAFRALCGVQATTKAKGKAKSKAKAKLRAKGKAKSKPGVAAR